MKKHIRLGYMPTRREFSSREDSLKYKDMILIKSRSMTGDAEEPFNAGKTFSRN